MIGGPKRRLSDAELRQRQNAARGAGRPRKNFGTGAARRAVAIARERGMRVTTEAVDNLISGMRGLLPPEKAPAIVACSVQLLNRFGCPPGMKIDEKVSGEAKLVFGLEGAAFPPAPKSGARDPES